jgi:hypothetical protein
VFTARYALSPYIKQIRFVFKGLTKCNEVSYEFCALESHTVLNFFLRFWNRLMFLKDEFVSVHTLKVYVGLEI